MPTRAHRQTDHMVPSQMFCPSDACPLRGQVGQQNIVIHSQREGRLRCTCCGRTFARTKGTPFYGLRSDYTEFVLVTTLLSFGCPRQAIVAAFGRDERTVADWQARAGRHCEQVHQAEVGQGQVTAAHVQADELWVKAVGRKFWMALALVAESRLWLGGRVAEKRDGALIEGLVRQVRRCLCHPGVLICVDGLASYVTAFRRVFAVPIRTGTRGRPRRELPAGFLLGQVVKNRVKKRVHEVVRRAVFGTLAAIEARLQSSGTGVVIHTAYIERLNATFRSRLAPLVRRGRALARREETLRGGMFLVGTVYNFCCFHEELRQPTRPGGRRRWEQRTPAIAAGLTNHRWSVAELLWHRIPPPPPKPPARRGRPPKKLARVAWKLRPTKYVVIGATTA